MKEHSFVTASLVLGVLAIVTTIMMTVYLPFILGGIAIILAILSRGNNKTFAVQAKTGIILATVGIMLNIIIIGGSVLAVIYIPEMREQFNVVFEQTYGQSFQEMLEAIRNGGTINI